MSLGATVSLIEIDYGGPGGIVFPSLFTARAPQGGGGGGGGGRVHNYPGPLASLLPGYSHFPRRVLLARVYVRSTTPVFLLPWRRRGTSATATSRHRLLSPRYDSRRSIKERREEYVWCGNGEGWILLVAWLLVVGERSLIFWKRRRGRRRIGVRDEYY